jgi:6-methylsalicylate decarboxylase
MAQICNPHCALLESARGMRALVPISGAVSGCDCRQLLEFDFDTTRAVTSLLVNGTLTRFPEICFIVSHSGAAVPTLAGRIQDRIPKDRTAILPKGALYELQRLYYEVAHATYAWPMAALANFVPPSHILFGTDYFFEPIETTVEQIPKSAIPSETWQSIYRANAEQLFPRLKV